MKTATENQIIINDFSTEDYNVYVDYSEDGEKTWNQKTIPYEIVSKWADFHDKLNIVYPPLSPLQDEEIHPIEFETYMDERFSNEDAASLIRFCQMFHSEILKS